jgi:hypothetical protein
MHQDIFTPGTYLIIVLLGLTIDVPLTVRHLKYSRTISTLRGWISSRRKKENLRNVEIMEVNNWAPKCPNCGRKMTLILYEKGPPAEEEVFGSKLADWNHPMLSLSYN